MNDTGKRSVKDICIFCESVKTEFHFLRGPYPAIGFTMRVGSCTECLSDKFFEDRAMKLNRYAAKQAKGKITGADLKRIYLDMDGCCAYCDVLIRGSFHYDHIRPLSVGGKHALGNLVLACEECNLDKSNKTVMQWLAPDKLEG